MRVLKGLSRVMELPWAYSLWQAPFLNSKFAPIVAHNDLTSVRRVLDEGCAPGTNARFFAHAEYVGLDINPAYLERARRKYRGTFVQADVRTYRPPPERGGMARYLAENDRGDYPRPWEDWQELLSRHFEPLVQPPFPVGMGGC